MQLRFVTRETNGLPDTGDEPVPDLVAVLLPILTVLGGTALLITVASVHKDHGHEHSVSPRDDVGDTTNGAHGVREHQVTDVVGVA